MTQTDIIEQNSFRNSATAEGEGGGHNDGEGNMTQT